MNRALLSILSLVLLSTSLSLGLAAPTYVLTDLGTLGGTLGGGVDLNIFGDVVGYSSLPGDNAGHAVLYSNGNLVDLGTLGGTRSFGYRINAAGQIAGVAYLAGDKIQHAFLYTGGEMVDLGSFGGDSGVEDLNDAGQVVGWAGFPGHQNLHAFLYDAGLMTDLGTLGGSNSEAFAINSFGQIAGFASTPDEVSHAIIYRNGVMTDLGTLGGTSSEGIAINTRGEVTGSSNVLNDVSLHAFLYRDGVMIDLGTLGGNFSAGYAINSAGEITGMASLAGEIHHPFVYSDGVMKDIGHPSDVDGAGHAINTAGQVVGDARLPYAIDTYAFVYIPGIGTVDLNSAIPQGSGWRLLSARQINDAGQITGTGIAPDGSRRGFLLTPVGQHRASVRRPISADGTSTFQQSRGDVPVKFSLMLNNVATCQLPAATVALTRTEGTVGVEEEEIKTDEASNFRINSCQYLYNLKTADLGIGTYRVDLLIDGQVKGSAVFSLN